MNQNKKGTRQERMPLKSEERKKERFVPFPFLLHQFVSKFEENFPKDIKNFQKSSVIFVFYCLNDEKSFIA